MKARYKKNIIAEDSERLVVLDRDVKEKKIDALFLKLLSWIFIFALTVFGLSHLTTMRNVYDWIDGHGYIVMPILIGSGLGICVIYWLSNIKARKRERKSGGSVYS